MCLNSSLSLSRSTSRRPRSRRSRNLTRKVGITPWRQTERRGVHHRGPAGSRTPGRQQGPRELPASPGGARHRGLGALPLPRFSGPRPGGMRGGKGHGSCSACRAPTPALGRVFFPGPVAAPQPLLICLLKHLWGGSLTPSHTKWITHVYTVLSSLGPDARNL